MIQAFEFSPFQENTYVIADDATGEAVIIDPGCYEQAEKEALGRLIEQQQTHRQVPVTHPRSPRSCIWGCLRKAYIWR